MQCDKCNQSMMYEQYSCIIGGVLKIFTQWKCVCSETKNPEIKEQRIYG